MFKEYKSKPIDYVLVAFLIVLVKSLSGDNISSYIIISSIFLLPKTLHVGIIQIFWISFIVNVFTQAQCSFSGGKNSTLHWCFLKMTFNFTQVTPFGVYRGWCKVQNPKSWPKYLGNCCHYLWSKFIIMKVYAKWRPFLSNF